MKRLLKALILSTLACQNSQLPADSAQSQTAQDYAKAKAAYDLCMQGSNQMNAHDYAGARDTYLQAISYDPSPYWENAHTNLGECYRQLKNFRQALDEEAVVLKHDPKSHSAMFIAAKTYQDMGDNDKALAFLQRYSHCVDDASSIASVDKQIKEARVYKNLIEATNCIGAQQDTTAIALLEAAAKDDPNSMSASVHAQLAYALRRSGSTEKAVSEGMKALSLNPNDYNTMYCIGIADSDLGRFDEGIKWIRKYIDMEPDPALKTNAQTSIKLFEQDKNQFNAPEAKESNYLDQRSQEYGRWSKANQKLKVYIGSGDGVRGYRKNFDSFITTALDTWCQASKSKLDYEVVKNSADADIVVRWTTDSLPASDTHPGTQPAGLTNYEMGPDQTIRTATISIRTVDPFNTTRTLQDGECAPVCLHEVGHSLGLAHSTCIKDTMYYRASRAQSGKLTARDQATIAMLYEDYPTTSFQPKTTVKIAPPTYLPPPSFMPPKPQDKDKLTPPMFLPPPIEKQKTLVPPMFTPPPISAGKLSSPSTSAPPAAPSFLPPPLSKTSKPKTPQQPFFMPPPK